jgi:hypothetical protein
MERAMKVDCPGFDSLGTTTAQSAPLSRFLRGRERCCRRHEFLILVPPINKISAQGTGLDIVGTPSIGCFKL